MFLANEILEGEDVDGIDDVEDLEDVGDCRCVMADE